MSLALVMLSDHLLWPKGWGRRGDQTPASMSPPAEGRSGPTNTPVSPPGSFVLPSFVWFYVLFSCGQVLLPALSWCSESTSVSEGVFLMYSWREMPSKSTDSSVILFLSNHFIPAAPFSFCLQSFLESGPFPVSRLFAPGDQTIGVSTSASALPMNIQGWFPLGLIG